MGWIAGIFGTLLKFILGSIFGKKPPSEADLAASNATNQSAVAAVEAGNEVITKGSAARAAADAKRLRTGDLNKVDPSASNPLNDSAGDFRD